MVRKRAVFLGYRLLARTAEILPARAIRPLSRVVGAVGVRVMPGKRRLVERNLRRVVGDEVSPRMTSKAFESYVRYWLEALRLPVVPVERLNTMFSATGLEHVLRARDEGKGVILVLPHMGNWDMAGAWLAAQGLPLTVVAERIEPAELFVWFRDFRTSLGLKVIANGPTAGAELLSALRRGEIVALLSDRDVDRTGTECRFFGETTTLPKGPATLALRAGAAIVPAAVYEKGDGYVAAIQPPLSVERLGRLGDDVDRVTRDIAAAMEALIRRAPEQWHLFQPNWPSDR